MVNQGFKGSKLSTCNYNRDSRQFYTQFTQNFILLDVLYREYVPINDVWLITSQYGDTL